MRHQGSNPMQKGKRGYKAPGFKAHAKGNIGKSKDFEFVYMLSQQKLNLMNYLLCEGVFEI